MRPKNVCISLSSLFYLILSVSGQLSWSSYEIPLEVQESENLLRFKKEAAKSDDTVCIKVPSDVSGNPATLCGPKVEKEPEVPVSVAVEKQRSATYPLSGGYGYHTIGQVNYPIHHFPADGYPQYWTQNIPKMESSLPGARNDQSSSETDSRVKDKNPADTLEPRTSLLLSKLLNQQPYAAGNSPQIYFIQAPPAPAPYVPYTPPPIISNSHHWFKSSEEDSSSSLRTHSAGVVQPVNIHQILPSVESRPTQQSLAVHSIEAQPQPAVHYSTQYVIEKPLHQVTPTSAQVIPTVSRVPVTLQCEIRPALTAFDVGGRSAEPQTTFSWWPKAHKPMPMSYGYLPLDQMLDRAHGGRSAEGLDEQGQYPNYVQQLRGAQLQYYYNEMMKNAAEIEKRAKEMETDKRSTKTEGKSKEELLKESEQRLENLKEQLRMIQELKMRKAELSEQERQSASQLNKSEQESSSPKNNTQKSEEPKAIEGSLLDSKDSNLVASADTKGLEENLVSMNEKETTVSI